MRKIYLCLASAIIFLQANVIWAEIFKDDQAIRQAVLENYIPVKLDHLLHPDKPIVEDDLNLIMNEIDKTKKAPDSQRPEMYRNILEKALTGLCLLVLDYDQDADIQGYANIYANTCAWACASLGAKTTLKEVEKKLVYPTLAYINEWNKQYDRQYKNSEKNYDSDLRILAIPELNMAYVKFTQTADQGARFSDWDDLCLYQNQTILCKSTDKDKIKFSFELRLEKNRVITQNNNNFDEYLVETFGWPMHLVKEFKLAKRK